MIRLRSQVSSTGLVITGRAPGEIWDETDDDNAARLVGLGVAVPVESEEPATPADQTKRKPGRPRKQG